ncbi:MAG: phosphopyruvate hydratase, partial [Anaplasmataceae bacterium]|nr:phosphopyruvate hydratase [Anaplasmataceae bacterium]
YGGKGVSKAISLINTEIYNEIINLNCEDQEDIDNALIKLDGTANKNRLGANGILATSLAIAKAAAKNNNIPLYRYIANLGSFNPVMPTPMVNIINGGMHADNSLAIQEFMIYPEGFSSIQDKLRATCEIFMELKIMLKKSKFNTSVGDEGGFAPNLTDTCHAIDLLMEAIEKTGYSEKVKIALDVAASSIYNKERYLIENKEMNGDQMIDFYRNLVDKYPIFSIEDGMEENDHNGWRNLTKSMNSKLQLVGDDIFVTNIDHLKHGIENNIANAILIKPNQIGTLSETIQTIKYAFANKYKVIVSHRSGETEDTAIAHLAVGCGCGQIKTGSISRSERVAKYNELLRIAEDNI